MPLPSHTESAPIANPDEAEGGFAERLWCVSFGAYGDTHVYAWADSLEDAFEVAVEHLDDEGQCGHFTILTEDDYVEAAEELGVEWDPESPDYEVMERAEADLTPIGWTTLECARRGGGSAFVPSWEWSAREVRGAERQRVEERSFEEIEAEEVA